MSRVDDQTLYLHLEVALATASPTLLHDLSDVDRYRRQTAVGEIARQLVERLRCFDIRCGESDTRRCVGQADLFPFELGPVA